MTTRTFLFGLLGWGRERHSREREREIIERERGREVQGHGFN